MENHEASDCGISFAPRTATASHTPGPWRLVAGDIHDHGDDGEANGFSILMGEYGCGGGRAIHHIHYANDVFPEHKGHAEAAANARLIAAAPDMLAALKSTQVVLASLIDPRPAESAAQIFFHAKEADFAVRIAIAKATGGTVTDAHASKEGGVS